MGTFNQNLGAQALPGMGPIVEQTSRKFLRDNNHKIELGIRIDALTKDVANTPTYKLRGGLALVRVEAAGADQGLYVHATHASAPAAADVESAVLLMQSVDMRDVTGEYEDKVASGLIHGIVQEDLVIFGTADATYIDAIKAALPLVMFL